MSSKLIEILVMEGIAALLFAFAYLVGVKGRLELIAGHNEQSAQSVKDRDGLRRLITRLCVLLGLATALMPLLTHFASAYPAGLAYTVGGYGGFILGVVGMVVLQSRDYTV